MNKKVNVVGVNTDFEEIDVMSWSEFQTYGFQGTGYFRGEDVAAVLYGTDQVVDEEGFVMWFIDVGWFPLHYYLV